MLSPRSPLQEVAGNGTAHASEEGRQPPVASRLALAIAATAALALGTAAQAAEWKAACPAAISTTQSVGGTLPAGWGAYARSLSAMQSAPPGSAIAGNSQPVSISVFDGPPQEMADLVPDNPNAKRPKWTFAKDRKRDIFLVCNYADTRMKVARKVPAEVRSCAVDTPVGPAVSVTCR